MATVLVILALVLLSSSASAASSADAVRMKCSQTRYPELCAEMLASSNVGQNQLTDFLSVLLRKAIHETSLPPYYFNGSVGDNLQAAGNGDSCKELMRMSLKRLNQALAAVEISPETQKSDIQTWLSAVITFQETCKDEAVSNGLSNPHIAKIYEKMEYLSKLVSNPLAMVNKIDAGDSPGNHSPPARRGFPSWISPRHRRLLQGTVAALQPNAVVAKDGSGNFGTVTEAIEAASGGGYVIYVKAGVYNENIMCRKEGITLVGDGKYSTIITGSRSVGSGSSLRGSSTFTIYGDGFIAKDIGFQNNAGPEEHQAVAMKVNSDRAVFYRCSFTGYQDTLYAHSVRQFYRECDIHGTVDFIFGNAAAVFQSCTLVLRRPRSGGGFNTILANGRSDPGQNTGFSVQYSKITVGSDFAPVKNSYNSYLGRPWKAYSRAVIMKTDIDGEVSSQGWVQWDGASRSTYSSLYFAEYANTGAGCGTSGRVQWPGFHVIGMPEATKFTVAAFIGGNSWLPPTGVSFLSGL